MSREIIDMHIHFGAPQDETYGCFWSNDFEKSVAYFAMLLMTKSLFKKVNINGLEKNLLAVINGSKYVQRTVLLALDLVFDETGKPHPEKTHLYVPNHYLAELARTHERVLWGASVHPYRPDWREALDFCLANGAVLCKIIPSSQLLNPDNADFNAFIKNWLTTISRCCVMRVRSTRFRRQMRSLINTIIRNTCGGLWIRALR